MLDVLKLGGTLRKAADTKQESENIIKRAQAVFRKSGEKKGVFHKAEHAELARPMLEVGGSALLAAFEATLMKTEDNKWVLLCLQGFYGGAQLTTSLGMQSLRKSFVTALLR